MDQHEVNRDLSAILGLIASPGGTDQQRRLNLEKIGRHQGVLRQEYGRIRGWTESPGRFFVRNLARISDIDESWPQKFTDHRSYWHRFDNPVAIVAHLYSCDDVKRAAAREWASLRGMVAKFPTDFSSWWYPGSTTLIEITRLER